MPTTYVLLVGSLQSAKKTKETMHKQVSNFDIRVVERHIKKGIITDKDLKDRIAALPDVIEKGVKIVTGEPLDPEEFDYEIK
jgi:hypothetical protein